MGIKTVRASNNYVVKATPANLPVAGTARSIMGWFEIVDSNPGGSLISYGTHGAASFNFAEVYVSGSVYVFGDNINGGNSKTIAGGDIPSAGLHHLGFGISDSTHWYYWLDGVMVESGTFGTAINTTATPAYFQICRNVDTGNTYPNSVNTSFDVRAYNRYLAAHEWETIYRARGADNIVDGLKLRWLLNEFTDGATASGAGACIDVSGNGNHGTPTSSPLGAAAPMRIFGRRIA